jgi:hypothetical protein
MPKQFLASYFQLLSANKRDQKSIKLNNIVVHFSLSVLPNIVAHFILSVLPNIVTHFNLSLLPGSTRPNQSHPHINLTGPALGTNNHCHHETHTTRRRAQIWWCKVIRSRSGHATEDGGARWPKNISLLRWLDLGNLMSNLHVGHLSAPISSTSAANTCLGICFSVHKLSQRLEHTYPLKRSRRILLNASLQLSHRLWFKTTFPSWF